MATYFSRSKNSFYDDKINPVIPTDAIEVTAEKHQAIFAELYATAGTKLSSDANGNPIVISPALTTVQAAKVSALSTQCKTVITGGFVSSALGSDHTYPSSMTDQQNLCDAMVAALASKAGAGFSTQLWCASTGVWSWAPHTVEQIKQVHADWIAFRLAQQAKLILATSAVNSAATADAVKTVTF